MIARVKNLQLIPNSKFASKHLQLQCNVPTYLAVIEQHCAPNETHSPAEFRNATFCVTPCAPMAPRAMTPGFPLHAFSSPAAFTSFLSTHHNTLPGFYLKLAKKTSGIPSITFPEATEVALCYGWIDGGGHTIDDTWCTVRYTPRRSKSIWSKRNVDTVERLIHEGKMTPAGLEVVDAAKKDGRWARAYAGPKDIQVAPDFQAALDRNEDAARFFRTLNSSGRYSVLWRIETASLKTRGKRIAEFVDMLAEERTPPLLTGTKKSKAKETGKGKGSTAEVANARQKTPATTSKSTVSVNATAKVSKVKDSVPAGTAASRRPGLRPRG